MDHWLGRYGTPENKEKYQRLIAEWLATLEAAVMEGFWGGDPANLLFISRPGQHG